jgi:hypothetical protein
VRSSRAILSLQYTPVGARGGIRQAAGAFLRYIHYRDQHVDQPASDAVDRMLRYVAHRDRSSTKGRLFTRDRVAGDAERRRLGTYVVRSTQAIWPRLARDGVDRRRAMYRMVISPKNARGLDLRAITRSAMARLEEDAGELPPWIAAEHRNTAHPHVHVVMAARRQSGSRFKTVLVTRKRLAGMKLAMAQEIARQRGRELDRRDLVEDRPARLPAAWPLSLGRAGDFLNRVQSAARRYQRQMERELERDLARREMEFAR